MTSSLISIRYRMPCACPSPPHIISQRRKVLRLHKCCSQQLLTAFSSILITYIRIFPFKANIICCYTLIVLALCTMVSDWFVMLLECFPIDFSGTVTKHCLNKLATNVFFTAWNSFLDFIVFLWPVRSLWAIQMPRQQRIALIVSFSTGVV